jgi:hypothetical protein
MRRDFLVHVEPAAQLKPSPLKSWSPNFTGGVSDVPLSMGPANMAESMATPPSASSTTGA